ncbi:hypothetical protein Y032_0115g484 [Ancylostoma ceylanicum]|uniref:SCP domain-containing protein n=1 Tax=Ancylostoma ceylanicum TaxID=53326 RepID=A0A016TBW7_9BILA|nr:hypothetical protein Y032_0115g484 [Ancylostoma ceylanicum]
MLGCLSSAKQQRCTYPAAFARISPRFKKLIGAIFHGVPDLRWNDHLAAQAQAWAERVARQAHISYKELSGIGENITFFPRDLDPEAIVEHWYEEHEKYEYETPGWQCGTNYFTQVIWRETEEV